ncbi:MAG: tetratricopeptide repeat protein [Clostridium sp.]|nr:tetratricopeptide repeat protein [Clostridium sp.]
MNADNYKVIYDDALEALAQGRLTDALACIESMLYLDTRTPDLTELNSLSADYKMMLDFMSGGGQDPQRKQVLHRLVRRITTLLDQVYRQAEIKYSSELHASTLRRLADDTFLDHPTALLQRQETLLSDTVESLRHNGEATEDNEWKQLHKTYETEGERLFNLLFTCSYRTDDETNELTRLVECQPVHIAALMVSAMFLNVWRRPDANLFAVIAGLCESTSAPLRCRALSAFVWCVMKYPRLTDGNDKLQDIIQHLKQNPDIRKELILIQKQWYISLETTRADRKMKEDILPTLTKNDRYYRHSMGFEDLDPEVFKNSEKIAEPDAKEKEKVKRHMEEFLQMSAEGIDINASTFTPLKGIPFFQKTANWFWPFDELRTEVSTLFPGTNQTAMRHLNLLLNKSGYCDSDCYSLIHMLNQMPEHQRTMLVSQLADKLTGSQTDFIQQTEKPEYVEPAKLYKYYFENMYRFMKCHPHRKEFEDLFEYDPFFINNNVLRDIVYGVDYLREIAQFLTTYEYYPDAEWCWVELRKYETNAGILCKHGYCQLQNNCTEEALETFRLAEVLEPDNKWLNSRIRQCYARLNLYDKELEYLLKAEAQNPEDADIMQETGLCLMRMERFEEAITRFYKMEFMEIKVWAASRAIAWCLLQQGKFDKADKYYTRIIEHGKAKWEDYLNAGHSTWLRGDVKRAIGLYREYMDLYAQKNPGSSAITPFEKDYTVLQELGMDADDLTLMRECLMFNS